MLLIPKEFLFFVFINFNIIHSVVSNQVAPFKSQIDNQTEVIITEILNNNCSLAEEHLLKIPNYSEKIPNIVREIYNGSEKNTNFILKCVKNLTQINISFKVLNALRDEMTVHDYDHYIHLVNLMELFNTIQSEVLHQTNGNESKPAARTLADGIQSDIAARTVKILKTAMLTHNFRNNPKVDNLTRRLYTISRNLCDSVMEQLVNEAFGQIPSAQMADDIYYGNSRIPQIVTGLMALFEKLKTSNDLNSEAVIRIAKNIKSIKNMNNFHNISKRKIIAINRLIQRLPVCARNLFFAQSLCIWNRGKSEYLYASDGQFYFTRRSVFTCSLDYIYNDGIWNVEVIDDIFYFRSKVHSREYLYASTVDRYGDANNRLVETWMDVGFLGETSGWNIELHGEFCYFKNENFNEYMFVSNETLGKLRRCVFTSTSREMSFDDQNYQWQLRNCG